MGEVNEGLSTLAIQAEADIWTNPRTTLTQGRLFSEELATIVSKMEKVEPVYSIKPSERVHLLSRRNVISDELKDSFDWLRKNGNMAAHDLKPIQIDLALSAHRHIFTLALWYAEAYGPLEIELPDYLMPRPIKDEDIPKKDHSVDMGEQIEQLLSAQFESKILPTMNKQFQQLHESIAQIAEMNNRNKFEQTERAENPAADIQQTTSIEVLETGNQEKSDMEIGEYLSSKGHNILDKRASGGALWIVGGWELKEELFGLKVLGAFFKFAKNGSQSTKRSPAWFLLNKKPVSIPINNEDMNVSKEEIAASIEETIMPEVRISEDETRKVDTVESTETMEQDNTTIKTQNDVIDRIEIRKSFLNKELVFPASMAGMSMSELNLKGNQAILEYLFNELKVTMLQELPENLSLLQDNIPGVGPKSIERFVKQLEEAIAVEKKLIGSGKRKENAVIAYRELKKKLGRRPNYIELHEQGSIVSQEYRSLFDSYINFLFLANELDKEEASVAKRYLKWFQEVDNTILRKSYKMTLLLVMLERGSENWMEPITADEAVPFFYDFYMGDETRKSVDFSDSETQKLWDAPLDRTAQLISRMPMTHWSKSSNKQVIYSNDQFRVGFQIKEADRELVYKWTKEICEYRLLHYFERKSDS